MSMFEEIELIKRPVNISNGTFSAGGIELPPYTFPLTLTPCDQVGPYGPNQMQMELEYFGTPLEKAIIEGAFPGYQEFTIRDTGSYQIKAMAGSGGMCLQNTSRGKGRPCLAKGVFALNAGDILVCIVGQDGDVDATTNTSPMSAGGGGMSAVFLNDVPLLISGAGSGAAYYYHGVADGVQHGNITSDGREGRVVTGSSDGGAMGEPGGANNAGSGAGWNADGHGSIEGPSYSIGSGSYFTGMTGGINNYQDQGHGGFGGGGAGCAAASYCGGGAGAGAGGGGGGTNSGSNAYVGGGGGTYVSPIATDPFINRTSDNEDNQYIEITRMDEGDNSPGFLGGEEVKVDSRLIIPVRKTVRL